VLGRHISGSAKGVLIIELGLAALGIFHGVALELSICVEGEAGGLTDLGASFVAAARSGSSADIANH